MFISQKFFICLITSIPAILLTAAPSLAATFNRLTVNNVSNIVGGGSTVNFTILNGDMDDVVDGIAQNINDVEIGITTGGVTVDFDNSDDPDGWLLQNVAGFPSRAEWTTTEDPILPNATQAGFILSASARTFDFEWGVTLDGVPQSGGGTISIRNGQLVVVPEPTSTLSFLALGTLGAGATLKRKLKASKTTEKIG